MAIPDNNETQLAQSAAAVARFIRTWKLEDTYLTEEFERELYYLLHLAGQVAIAPVSKQMLVLAEAATPRLFPSPEVKK